MLNKSLAISLICLFSLASSAQTFTFSRTDTIQVSANSNQQNLAWSGGLNNAQYSSIDLNQDGTLDIFVFERDGNQILPFVHSGAPNSMEYTYAPEYKSSFPELTDWVLLRDYNMDGKVDIFARAIGGLKVYKNISTPGNLTFVDVTDGPYVYTDFGSGPLNLYVPSEDIPAIYDQDGDGDLDIVSFGVSGTRIEYHLNKSMELYGVPDSLVYEMESLCFGDMEENLSNNSLTLDVCTTPPQPCRIGEPGSEPKNLSTEGGVHAGSTLLLFDSDNDGDNELVLGDISFNNLILARNGGCSAFADMDSVILNYPSQSPVDLPLYPAAFHLDIDNDGIRDLVSAPAARNISVSTQCNWYYKNVGIENAPVWQYSGNDFLEGDMIDVGQRAIPVFADLTGNGLQDLVIGNYGYYISSGNYVSQLAFYANVGTSAQASFELVTLDFADLSTFSGLPVSLHPTFADIDNDGDLDMIIGDSAGKLHLFTNTGDATHPTFSLTQAEIGGIDVGDFAAPFLIDLDGDQLIDLAVGERDGSLNFIKNIGNLSSPNFAQIDIADFGEFTVKPAGSFQGLSAPYFAMVNNDINLFVGNIDGHIFQYNNILGNLNGGFTLVDSIVSNINNGGYATPALTNLTGNSDLDLVIGNRSGGVYLFEGSMSPIGIYELNPFDVKVYPIPATDIIQVESARITGNYEFDIIAIDGKIVKSGMIKSGHASLDLSSLSQGFYVLRLKADGHESKLKLIIE